MLPTGLSGTPNIPQGLIISDFFWPKLPFLIFLYLTILEQAVKLGQTGNLAGMYIKRIWLKTRNG